jgi:DNA-binding CsgD family transcriptional regulator
MEWILAQEAILSSPTEVLRVPVPYAVSGPTGTVTIQLLRQGLFRLLLLEEVSSSITLAALGLSPRETAALNWVVQGKTNPEIGLILGISRRTVQKHLERIYIKLGVENRTAAAAMVAGTTQSTDRS